MFSAMKLLFTVVFFVATMLFSFFFIPKLKVVWKFQIAILTIS